MPLLLKLVRKKLLYCVDWWTDYVNGVRPRLRTAATNGPTVHPPGDIWARRTMVEWYRQSKTPDSSTRAIWQSYQQSPTSKQEKWEKEMIQLALRSIFVHTSQVVYVPYNLTTRDFRLYFSSVGRCAANFYRPYKAIVSAEFKRANLGSNDKHPNHCTTDLKSSYFPSCLHAFICSNS
jgi:hypothetical protein